MENKTASVIPESDNFKNIFQHQPNALRKKKSEKLVYP